MYFNAIKGNSEIQNDKLVIKHFFEQRLEQFKQECTGEILRELLRIFISGRIANYDGFFHLESH